MNDVVEELDDYSPPFHFELVDGRIVRFKRMGMEEWVAFIKEVRLKRERALAIKINAEIPPEEWQKRLSARAVIETEIRQTNTIHNLMDQSRFDPETILAVLQFAMVDIRKEPKEAQPAIKPVAFQAAKPAVPGADGKPAQPAVAEVLPVRGRDAIPADPGFPSREILDTEKAGILRRISPVDQMQISREIVLNATVPPLDPFTPASSGAGDGVAAGGNVPPMPNPPGENSEDGSKLSGPDSAPAA